MATKPQNRDVREERVAKALANLTIAELRKLVREMEAELRRSALRLVN
jgi:hypothetical protein